MSGNKEALIRYRAINRCLCNQKVASKEQLISACSDAVGTNVSWRTIAQDIHAMRYDEGLKFYAPISNVKKLGYRYDDPNFSIDHVPLSDRDLQALSFASRLLKQYSSVSIFNQFANAVDRLNDRVSVRMNDGPSTDSFIGFEQDIADSGSHFLNDWIHLIKDEIVGEFQYKSFTRDELKTYLIHPYYLKQYRNRWYVIGLYEETKSIRTFALDRMHSVQPNYSTSYEKSSFDPEEYYKHAIGISVYDTKPEKVLLRVSSQQAPYVLSSPIHNSQTVIDQSKNHIDIELMVIRNYELKSIILSMGSEVEVLNPKSLRDEINDQHRKALSGDNL